MKVIYGDIGFPPSPSPPASVDYGFRNERGEAVTTKNIQREWFKRISYIPQSSMSSLNPVVRIRDAVRRFSGNVAQQSTGVETGTSLHREARATSRSHR